MPKRVNDGVETPAAAPISFLSLSLSLSLFRWFFRWCGVAHTWPPNSMKQDGGRGGSTRETSGRGWKQTRSVGAVFLSFSLSFSLSLSFGRERERERERERSVSFGVKDDRHYGPLGDIQDGDRGRKPKKKKPKQKGKKRNKKNETVAPQTATMTIGWLLPSFFFLVLC